MKKINRQIDLRENYLLDNGINPENALEYMEKRQRAESQEEASRIKYQNTQKASKSRSKAKNKSAKGKQAIEVTSCEDSLMANSDTYACSSTTQLKSPSRADTLSYFESSPMLKRVKFSEEEKRRLEEENFQLSDSNKSNLTATQPLRKSNRKRKKSKILREAIGELEEEEIVQSKKPKKKRESKEITKMLELDAKCKKREETIPQSKNKDYLVEFQHNFKTKDTEQVCFCETVSYDQMIACDNSSCPIEWFHFN